MKGLRLIPRSWNPADAVSLQSPPLHIPDEDSAGTPTLEFSHESNDAGEMHKLAPEKARQLREYVGGITHTPVVKPRRSECIFENAICKYNVHVYMLQIYYTRSSG